jgi:hypothetical protein
VITTWRDCSNPTLFHSTKDTRCCLPEKQGLRHDFGAADGVVPGAVSCFAPRARGPGLSFVVVELVIHQVPIREPNIDGGMR